MRCIARRFITNKGFRSHLGWLGAWGLQFRAYCDEEYLHGYQSHSYLHDCRLAQGLSLHSRRHLVPTVVQRIEAPYSHTFGSEQSGFFGFLELLNPDPKPPFIPFPSLLQLHMGVSENGGPECSTLNSRILIIKTPK